MANALTDLALYSALSEQVYRRANVKDKADQPLLFTEDGNQLGREPFIAGQELVNPKRFLDLDTNPLTAGRFQFDNSYIYNTATGFVAMVTKGADGRFNVTFRSTDAGDTSQWTFATATPFKARREAHA